MIRGEEELELVLDWVSRGGMENMILEKGKRVITGGKSKCEIRVEI